MKKTRKYLIMAVILMAAIPIMGQGGGSEEETATFKTPLTQTWFNTYGNIRISDRFFWIAQTHFRFQESASNPFLGQIAQLYNRHAINYLYSKRFNMSLGGVLRVNFNPNESTPTTQNTVPEWRIWHEYLYSIPIERLMFYHRIRIEHRWTRGFNQDAEWTFRNRWRYMFTTKIPINKAKLGPQTFYIAPEAEIIMQSGSPVIDSPLEDLRLHTSLGYIINPRVKVAAGLMYSIGQELTDGAIYKQKWTARFHVYFAPDFRKIKNKLPAIHQDE